MPHLPTQPLIQGLELITTVDLSYEQTNDNPPRPVYHFLYATSLYGTLFGIYGQFIKAPTSTQTRYDLQAIRMRILNYQGVVNMGFTRNRPVYDGLDIIDFEVQGASEKDDTDITFGHNVLTVNKGARVRLNFNRTVVPIQGYTVGQDHTTPIPAPPEQKEKLFDTEFHYRNGIDHYHQAHRDGMQGLVGVRCITSSVNLIY